MTIQPGEVLFGKYRVLRHLGSGAFADVYLVEHEQLGVERALKLLRRDKPGVGSTAFSDMARRFDLEAQLGARHLDDRYLVSVLSREETSEALALEMEYAAGGSLQQRLEAAERGSAQLPDPAAVIDLLRELAAALASLHDRDVVHRDIKPSNILFHADGRAMLADLGLAQVKGSLSRGRSLGDEQDGYAMHPGTPPYRSPEAELPGLHLQPSSDVYGLGVVAYEALTGRLLPNVRPADRWSLLPEGTPDWLRELLRSMVSLEPSERPWDGAELGEWIAAGIQADAEARERARREAEEAERRREAEAAEVARRDAAAKAEAERQEADPRRRQEQEREAVERREREQRAREAQQRREAEAAEQARKAAEAEAARAAQTAARDEHRRQKAHSHRRQGGAIGRRGGHARIGFWILAVLLEVGLAAGIALLGIYLDVRYPPWLQQYVNLAAGLGGEVCDYSEDVTISAGETLGCNVIVWSGSLNVEEDALVDGQVHVITGSARIDGRVDQGVWAGQDVEVDGRVGGDVVATLGRIEVSGDVLGSVRGFEGEVSVHAGAHVSGDVISDAAVVDDGARIDGEVRDPSAEGSLQRLMALGAWGLSIALAVGIACVLVVDLAPGLIPSLRTSVIERPALIGGLGGLVLGGLTAVSVVGAALQMLMLLASSGDATLILAAFLMQALYSAPLVAAYLAGATIALFGLAEAILVRRDTRPVGQSRLALTSALLGASFAFLLRYVPTVVGVTVVGLLAIWPWGFGVLQLRRRIRSGR